MYLVTEQQHLTLALAEAATTTAPTCVAVYDERRLSTGSSEAHTDLLALDAPVVTAVAAPQPGLQREVRCLALANPDTVAHTVSVQLREGDDVTTLLRGTLEPGATLAVPNGLIALLCRWTQSLVATLDAPAAMPVQYSVAYCEGRPEAPTRHMTVGILDDAGETVTIVAAPLAGLQRRVTNLTLHNPNGETVIVWIGVRDGSQVAGWTRIALPAHDSWSLADATAESVRALQAAVITSINGVLPEENAVTLTPAQIGAEAAVPNRALLVIINQDVSTAGTPEFAGVAVTGFSGVIKAVAGVLAGGATTDDLPEGATRQYHTATRVNDVINALKGIASGLATLDANGKLPTAQLPPLAIKDYFPADSEAGMLALTAERGDMCGRSDVGIVYMLTADDPTVLANWVPFNAPATVVSVNGQTGTVLLTTDHLGEGATNKFYTDERTDARISAQKGQINGIASLGADGKVPSGQLPAIPTTANQAEVNAGTDTQKYLTPATLRAADQLRRTVSIKVIADATSLATGDGQATWVVPASMAGMNLVGVGAHVFTASSSGLPTVQIARVRGGTPVDMLSTRITIDANEKDSATAATAAVIDAANDDIAEGDEIRVDVDVAGTGTKGLEVRLTFQVA